MNRRQFLTIAGTAALGASLGLGGCVKDRTSTVDYQPEVIDPHNEMLNQTIDIYNNLAQTNLKIFDAYRDRVELHNATMSYEGSREKMDKAMDFINQANSTLDTHGGLSDGFFEEIAVESGSVDSLDLILDGPKEDLTFGDLMAGFEEPDYQARYETIMSEMDRSYLTCDDIEFILDDVDRRMIALSKIQEGLGVLLGGNLGSHEQVYSNVYGAQSQLKDLLVGARDTCIGGSEK